VNPEEPEGALAVLANRHFRVLWLAQIASQVAQHAIIYGLVVHVEERTRSSIQMSVLVLSSLIPMVVFAIVAGALVDRMTKRNVLVTTNWLRALVVLGFLLGRDSMPIIFLLAALFSTIGQFFGPAEVATIPLLVPRRQLLAANGIFNLTYTASQLGGLLFVGPPLFKLLGFDGLFIVAALSFMVAAVLVATLPANEPVHAPLTTLKPAELADLIRSDLLLGLRMLREDATLGLAMVQWTAATTLLFVLGVLAPGYAGRVLGAPVEDAVFIFAPAGLGILLATLLLPALARYIVKPTLVNLGLFATAATLFLLGLLPRAYGYLARDGLLRRLVELGYLSSVFSLVSLVLLLSFVLGLGFAFVNITAQTIIQEQAPAYMRAKLFSIQLVFASIASVLPLILVGAMADFVGIPEVILLIGGLVGVLGVVSLQYTRQVVGISAQKPGSSDQDAA